jgi:inosose dehydratase
MGPEWEPQRGTIFGCGMTTTPLGDGRVGIPQVVESLLDHGFDGPTTMEIAGGDNLKTSAKRLHEWAASCTAG